MAIHFLSAEWRHLLMLNFEVDPRLLLPLVPKGTELDEWEGAVFLSVVGFRFLRARLFGFAVPFHGSFDEVNLRFYVRRRTNDGWRRGVVFIKELVPKLMVAAMARFLYGEKFARARIRSRIQLPQPEGRPCGIVEYRWGVREILNRASAELKHSSVEPSPGSLEQFIAEHYWAYTKRRDGATVEYRVKHPPWRIWPATSVRWDCDVARVYGTPYLQCLDRRPLAAFVAEGSPVNVFRESVISSDRADSEHRFLL